MQSLNGEARVRLRASGDLGDDVTVKAERGERQFATGDRIMFLRNERGMGVKNGTLATIERVSSESMAVRLDDGRGVAFDTKDYAHVDHGYAATFHKSQGVTVDRAHILATPGMDRHSAYVGMSRHRDAMQLHYGRDDFADQRQLVRALSRERGKDMAGGVARQHALHAKIVGAHKVAGYILLALLVLHVLGALKHQFIDRRDQLSRMWFRSRSVT